jgi:hypothetical protein
LEPTSALAKKAVPTVQGKPLAKKAVPSVQGKPNKSNGQNLSKKMSLFPRVIKVPWGDEHSNDRIHLVIHLPDGTRDANIGNIHLIEGGSKLKVQIKACEKFLTPAALLSHPSVGGLDNQHPKVSALNKAVDDLVSRSGSNEGYSWEFVVSLGIEAKGYDFTTDKNYSGHDAVVYQQVPRKIDGDNIANPTAILLIDLVKETLETN